MAGLIIDPQMDSSAPRSWVSASRVANTKSNAFSSDGPLCSTSAGLAKGALDQTSRRDPQKIYHKLSNQELAALSPAFNWNTYFEDVGAPRFDSLNVVEPDFIKNMQEVYIEPELKLAGEATEIIQGSQAAGVDYDAMVLVQRAEFETD